MCTDTKQMSIKCLDLNVKFQFWMFLGRTFRWNIKPLLVKVISKTKPLFTQYYLEKHEIN